MRFFLALALLTLAGTLAGQEYQPPPTPTPTPLPIPGTTERSLRKIFLETSDLEPSIHLRKQVFSAEPDPTDTEFAKCNGLRLGAREWHGESQSSTIARLLDIRFVFPTEADAERYIGSALDYLREGVDEIDGAPSVGENSRIFGTRLRQPGKPETETVRGFICLFRERNIVAKVVVSQGSDAGDPLDMWGALRLAQKVLARINLGAPRPE